MRLSARRLVAALLCAAAALAVLALGYRLVTDRLVSREDREAPRDGASGVRLGCEDRTLGPEDSPGAVLLVHGFVGCGQNFAGLPERLAARGWHVRVMRLPGHGTSPRDYERTTPADLEAAVRSELAALRLRGARVVLVGHSMGGALSTIAAAEDGADGLVLIGAYFGVTRRWWYGLRPETWTGLALPFRWVYKGRLFLQVNRREAAGEILTYTWVPVRGLLTLHEVGRRARDPKLLSRVRCPVLVLHSRGDAASSPERAAEALAAMASPRKRLVWLDRSNHHILFDHDREQAMEEVLSFLGDPPPPAAPPQAPAR